MDGVVTAAARLVRPALALAASAALALASGCASSASGHFEASGPRLGRWSMEPDKCLSGLHRGYVGADLFRADVHEDTEIVVVQRIGVDTGPTVLARVPGSDEMVVFRADDCATLAIDVHGNGVKVNGTPAVTGTITLECDKPGFGSIRGTAAFTCY